MNPRASYISAGLLAFIFFLCTLAPAAHAGVYPWDADGAGDGSPENPFQIKTCEDLQGLDVFTEGQGFFKLMNDIDCTMTPTWNGGAGFLPIGDSNAGTAVGIFLNGNFKTIYGLYINRPNDSSSFGDGLFSALAQSVVINVTLAGGEIHGGSLVGAFAGGIDDAFVGGVSSYGMTVTASSTADAEFAAVGGLIGLVVTDGDLPSGLNTIDHSSAGNAVSVIGDAGNELVGGLIGILANSTLTNSYSTSTVQSPTIAGGLVGLVSGNFFGNTEPAGITKSYAESTVTSDGQAIGGLVGLLEGDPVSITDSFSLSTMSGAASEQGGIVGEQDTSVDPPSIDPVSVGFDQDIAGDPNMRCVGSDPSILCGGLDNGNPVDTADGAYFFGNSTNHPLDDFDFDNVWQVVPDAPPILQNTFGFSVFGTGGINSIQATADDTSATITWNTSDLDLAMDSQILYGTSDAYGLSTALADTDPLVFDHEMVISGLSACTIYHYKILGRDALNNLASSTDQAIETACTVSPAASLSSSGGSVGSAALALLLAPSPAATAYLNSLKGAAAVAPAAPVLPAPGCPARFVCTPLAAPVTPPTASSTALFTRDLQVGSIGPEVLSLQKYLNAHGYVIAASGPGSLGHETNLFGGLTKAAVMKLQKAHGLPMTGFFGAKTRAVI